MGAMRSSNSRDLRNFHLRITVQMMPAPMMPPPTARMETQVAWVIVAEGLSSESSLFDVGEGEA